MSHRKSLGGNGIFDSKNSARLTPNVKTFIFSSILKPEGRFQSFQFHVSVVKTVDIFQVVGFSYLEKI